MVNSLDKKWKELLFSFSGFGPNFLMVLMGAYFTDAINPVALGENAQYQAIASGTCFILPLVFPVLYMLGKIFDGLIDIPFAHITDTLSTKWGRRRPAIAVCSIPMVLSYAMCWLPIGGADGKLFNTVWISVWCVVFFASYTMCLIAFYGSLSTVCTDEPQRLRVSGYKSFFDTISYCLVYALVPLLLDAFNLHIDKFVYVCMPLMLTIAIPLFMIKEGEKYGYPENDGLKVEKISIIESLKLTFGNKIFLAWLVVNSCTFFGLQMFLVAMNAMIDGGMGFNGLEMAIINTCAFGPVPVMLYLFNKLKAKKGVRFTYQTCLLAFAVAIMSFFFSSLFVTGGNKTIQYVISIAGGIMGSWAIGAFFMMPYLAPAQVSAVEEKLTGKNHSAMYFAANALVTSIVGAVSGTLVYDSNPLIYD
jgi:Na+/melibiose symporter-like transporter